MSRLPLRVRLVAGFVIAMLVLLTAAGAFVYWRVEYALDRGLDTELDQATAVITPLVGPTGEVTSPDAADATGAGWQVVDGAGRVVDSGGTAPTAPLVSANELDQVGGGTLTKDIGKLLPIAAKPYRVQVTALNESPDHYLVVGVRRDHRDEALRELLLQLTLAGLGALAVAAVIGDLLARAALRPVERYRRRAAEIADGANGLRLDVPEGRDDEVTRLGHTLNDMLAALERSLERERRFVNEASHELRTPLTLLKSRIQLAQRRARTVEEHEAVLDELAVDVARLTALAEELLALGAAGADTGATDAGTTVADVVARRRLAFPDEEIDLARRLDSSPIMVAIAPMAFERVVDNLLTNAFTHGQPPVRVRMERVEPAWLRLSVEDHGPGMDAELLDQATQRFTRAAEARSRPGAGLGLALVERIVDLAGGELRLCHGGNHVSHGRPSPAPCSHPDSMTVTVFLPTLEDHLAPA